MTERQFRLLIATLHRLAYVIYWSTGGGAGRNAQNAYTHVGNIQHSLEEYMDEVDGEHN